MTHRFTSRISPALVALLVLAACGGDSDAGSSPVDAPPGGSTNSSQPAGMPDLRVPEPIEMVSGSSGATPEDAPASAETGAATSDMVIAPWAMEYIVGDGLPNLPTDDTGYVFDAADDVTIEQVVAVAAAFGVEGQPVRVDEGYGASWRVGPEDGSGPSVWVSDDGQQSWSYNAPWDEGAVVEPCAISVDADGNETTDCPEPEPPVGVPTTEQAEQRAQELLAAFGVEVSGVSFESFGDQWFASVEAAAGSDQRAATRTWSFGFGGDGVLQYAWGTLAEPQPVGPYPLIDLDTAVARLSEGYFGGFGGVAVAETEAAVSEPAPGGEGVADAAGDRSAEPESLDEPVESPVPEPMPVEPLPDGEPVVVTLVDVQADLWWVWDADGSVWLLPAYRFIDTDGGWHVVPAVTDEYMIQTDPVVVDPPVPAPEPLPAPAPEPDAPAVDPSIPAPTAETPKPNPTEPDVPPPGLPEEGDAEPGTDPVVDVSVLDEYVGLTIDEFTAEAEALGFSTRIVQQDGEPLAVTADYSPTRVNVVVDGSLVTAIDSIG